ncbi:hypothetical protein ACROYT_G015122 [Oculina patagonica]
MSAYETPLRAPKTPEYRPNPDEDITLFPDPNLDSEPEIEASPPASQLEPRHKAQLAKQSNNEGQHLPQENLPRNSQSRQPRKRKHEDATSAVEFKKQKTETSILKLERHLEQKTCPKSLQYKAKANVTPDETFRQEISAIKSHAEEQFVSALVRYHKRRLISHTKKLEKASIAKSRSQNNASAEAAMDKRFLDSLKLKNSVFNQNLAGLVVDESHTVETWAVMRHEDPIITPAIIQAVSFQVEVTMAQLDEDMNDSLLKEESNSTNAESTPSSSKDSKKLTEKAFSTQ